MKTVLVTGGSGFLGSWCVIDLLRRGYGVRTTVRDLSREAALRGAIAPVLDAGDRLSVLAADLRSDDGWERAVSGCDYVLHVASPFPPVQPKDPDELIVPAREGTLRVLEASLDAGVQRVVVTSSIAAITGALKPSSPPLTEVASPHPRDDRRLRPEPDRHGRRQTGSPVEPAPDPRRTSSCGHAPPRSGRRPSGSMSPAASAPTRWPLQSFSVEPKSSSRKSRVFGRGSRVGYMR